MTPNTYQARLGLLAACVIAALTGCGGASNNAGPAPAATPTIYGVNPATTAAGSSLQSADAKTGYLTGAVSTTAKALELGGTIPFGFAAGGLNADAKTVSVAAPVGASVAFRTLIANGNAGNGISAIVPSSVVLTSPEVTGFSQPLTFDGAGVTLNDGQYTTAAFPLPFTTSGIHQFTAAVADVAGQSSSTTLGVVVLSPTDSGIFASVTPSVPSALPAKTTATVISATATITNPVTGATAQPTPDDQGNIILFTAPGSQTVSVTAQVRLGLPDGTKQTVTEAGTDTETLVAGQMLTTITTTDPGPPVVTTSAPYTVTVSVPGTTGSAAKPHLFKRH